MLATTMSPPRKKKTLPKAIEPEVLPPEEDEVLDADSDAAEEDIEPSEDDLAQEGLPAVG